MAPRKPDTLQNRGRGFFHSAVSMAVLTIDNSFPRPDVFARVMVTGGSLLLNITSRLETAPVTLCFGELLGSAMLWLAAGFCGREQ